MESIIKTKSIVVKVANIRSIKKQNILEFSSKVAVSAISTKRHFVDLHTSIPIGHWRLGNSSFTNDITKNIYKYYHEKGSVGTNKRLREEDPSIDFVIRTKKARNYLTLLNDN